MLPLFGIRSANRSTKPMASRSYRALGTTLLTICASSSLVVTPVLAAPSLAAKKLSPLAVGEQFYRGKTVTIVTYASAGAAPDLWARLLGGAMSSYLGATFNVEDVTAANSIGGQDDTAAAPPDGLTIGMLDPIADVELQITHTPGLNFNPIRLAFIGSPAPTPSLWVSSPNSPYTNWAAVLHSATPVKILSMTTGTGYLTINEIVGIFGIKASIITGYTNTGPLIQGFERGDGQVTEGTMASFGPLVAAGQARPILLSGPGLLPPAFIPYLKNVPTVAEVAKKFPPKTRARQEALTVLLDSSTINNIFAAPTAIPNSRLLALRAALKYALTDKALYSQELQDGLTPGYYTPQQDKLGFITAQAHASALAPFLPGA